MEADEWCVACPTVDCTKTTTPLTGLDIIILRNGTHSRRRTIHRSSRSIGGMHTLYRSHLRLGALALLAVVACLAPVSVEAFNLFGTPKTARGGVATGSVAKVSK